MKRLLPKWQKSKPVLYQKLLKESFYLFDSEISRFLDEKTPEYQYKIIDTLEHKKKCILDMFRRGTKTAKTTRFAIWRAWRKEYEYIFYFTGSGKQEGDPAEKIDSYVDIFEKNTGIKLKSKYRNRWTVSQKRFNNQSKIVVTSIFGRFLGAGTIKRRPTCIIADDVLSEIEWEAEMRRLIPIWTESITFLGEESTQFILAGTRRGDNDLLAYLAKDPSYYHLIIPVFKSKFEKISIWEDRHPTAELLEQQRHDPVAFERQMLCNPIPRDNKFKMEWLQFFKRNEFKIMEGGMLYILCDLAESVSIHADYSGIMVVYHLGDHWYILKSFAVKGIDATGALLVKLQNEFRPNRIFIEAPGVLHELCMRTPSFKDLKLVEYITYVKMNKQERIASLEPFLIAKYVHICENENIDFIREYNGFPTIADDHILDCFQMGINKIENSIAPLVAF